MVDLDELDKKKGSSSSSKSKSSSSSKSKKSKSSSSSSGSSEPYSMDDDEMMDPSGKSMSQTSKDWAGDKGDLNYQADNGEGLNAYMKRQVKEVEELHDNIEEIGSDHMDNFDEFTLYFHALYFNLARNRVGIFETVKDRFGKSDEEALKITKKICKKAGEKEFLESELDKMVRNLAEV